MSWLGNLFSRRKRMMDALDDDIRDYIERETEDNIARGMPPKEARYAALRKFGNVTRVKEDAWELWSWVWLEQLGKDIRFALRMLAKNPGFTAVAVLTLALGIGANATIFTLLDALVLRPVPVSHAERLFGLQIKSPQGVDGSLSYLDYEDMRQQVKSFSGIALYYRAGRFLNSLDESGQVLVDEVTPDYFKVLGVQPLLGRVFSPEIDNRPQSPEAVVISYRLWRGRLGGDPAIVGKQIQLTGTPAIVIGVTQPYFQGMARYVPTDMWLLSSAAIGSKSGEPPKRSGRWFEGVARLGDGVTPAQATAELETLSQRLAAAYPETNRARTFQLFPETMDQRSTWLIGLLSMALPGVILLIACANLAGLLLARAETRRREMAVRVALGATRWDVLRQLSVEGLILSLSGGTLGLVLTVWLMSFQRALMPAEFSFLGPDMRVDAREIAFTAGISVVATLMFTITPALHAWKVGLASVIKGEEVLVWRGRRRVTARNLMVVGQMALSVVVMTLSLLFLRSLYHVRNLPVGFDTHSRLSVMNVFTTSDMPAERLLPVLVEKASGLPGVRRATYAIRILLSGSGGGANASVSIPGHELPEGQSSVPIRLNAVGPGYFQTVGTRIIQGREFTSADGPQSQSVVIISQFMAQRFWPHGDAVGKFIKVEKKDTLIVGIAEDAKIIHILEPPQPYMYLPFAQSHWGEGAVIVQSAQDPDTIIPLLRQQIHSYSPSIVIWGVCTTKSLLDGSTLEMIMEFRLAGLLSLIGVLLAAMGLYGVVAYIVRTRTREIGVRLALGARLQQVQGLFVMRGLKLALPGVLLGVLAALGAGQLAAGLIYGVKPYDPVSLAIGAAVVAVVALLASYLPARRATKVDPMVALRHE